MRPVEAGYGLFAWVCAAQVWPRFREWRWAARRFSSRQSAKFRVSSDWSTKFGSSCERRSVECLAKIGAAQKKSSWFDS